MELNFRVCVAVAETHHALRRETYVAKAVPLHAGSASPVLPAGNPDLADQILSAPLTQITHTLGGRPPL